MSERRPTRDSTALCIFLVSPFPFFFSLDVDDVHFFPRNVRLSLSPFPSYTLPLSDVRFSLSTARLYYSRVFVFFTKNYFFRRFLNIPRLYSHIICKKKIIVRHYYYLQLLKHINVIDKKFPRKTLDPVSG